MEQVQFRSRPGRQFCTIPDRPAGMFTEVDRNEDSTDPGDRLIPRHKLSSR